MLKRNASSPRRNATCTADTPPPPGPRSRAPLARLERRTRVPSLRPRRASRLGIRRRACSTRDRARKRQLRTRTARPTFARSRAPLRERGRPRRAKIHEHALAENPALTRNEFPLTGRGLNQGPAASRLARLRLVRGRRNSDARDGHVSKSGQHGSDRAIRTQTHGRLLRLRQASP